MDSSEVSFRGAFAQISGSDPYPYQQRVADYLFAHRNIVLRAPTGAGKTLAVLAPFFCNDWAAKPSRLIYALPLRTLANGIYAEAQRAAAKLGKPLEAKIANGREMSAPFVTMQTGEQPDDPFFDRGRIIITTYDQVLSGLLDGPYGLSDRLHNINAAAIAGALVVFDEFHLMPPQKAFLTAVAGLHLFDKLCQSVWMTATATEPLEAVLRDALHCAPVPSTPEEAAQLHAALPSVRDVVRNLVMEDAPLSADAVLKFPDARSIVLSNTVGRAQDLYRAITAEMARRNLQLSVRLLHSRFFKQDRQKKEAELRDLFGRSPRKPAILIATQVLEAGIDISCDHLHTELCPMNSLVQRAGRCARFPNETGTVHVYPLPDDRLSWLPYGDLKAEDAALTRTRQVLSETRAGVINPKITADWVERAHAADDALAVQFGWANRQRDLLERIHSKAILRQKQIGVADLIRGENSDSVQVIVARENDLPDTPSRREAVGLSRWSLARYFDGVHQIGWYWDGSADDPWLPLISANHQRLTYAIALRPEFARYSDDVGLLLGQAGEKVSPNREPIKRPGYGPLHAETWVHHAQAVAAETARRLDTELPADGMLSLGFAARLGLDSKIIREAARACALLHDLGKLQTRWQEWAQAAMETKRPGYALTEPLAHTDFNPDDPTDRVREREVKPSRPAHAPASAFYSLALIASLLPTTPIQWRTQLGSACLAAILAHHGGWLPEPARFAPGQLYPTWQEALSAVIGDIRGFAKMRMLAFAQKHGPVAEILKASTGADSLRDWWPLVSYLSRNLRLSDQRATAESHNHE